MMNFRDALCHGIIPLGELRIPIDIRKNEFMEVCSSRSITAPRTWAHRNTVWSRFTVPTDILWYSNRLVSFTFRDDILALVEFGESDQSSRKWDYSVEIKRYFDIKKLVIEHLGDETTSIEAVVNNMEAVWQFSELSFFISCDTKTGGCSIALHPALESKK